VVPPGLHGRRKVAMPRLVHSKGVSKPISTIL
jgi:hypothetical protein